MHKHFQRIIRAKNLIAAIMLAATMTTGAIVTATPALAASTSCKTLNLSGDWAGFAINPHMSVPICYNGSSVWQSGNVTPGVSTVGWYVGGFDWYGTYGGGSWLGAGENFTATLWTNATTIYCSPRWGINPSGNVISYSRNC